MVASHKLGCIRLSRIQKNVPYVIKTANAMLEAYNVVKRVAAAKGPVAYLLADISSISVAEAKEMDERIRSLDSCLKSRILRSASDQDGAKWT